MDNLISILENFNLNDVSSERDLNMAFSKIARCVLYGGHFSIDEQLFIYPCDIEFYCHSDLEDAPKWKRDYGMYHIGKLPYFKKCSLFPHRSGVDFRFEDEKEQFRASFLIRGYEFRDSKASKEEDKFGRVENPTYLWEDLFGYCKLQRNGLNIQWIDEEYREGMPISDVRHNLCKYDDYNKPSIPQPGERTLKGRIDRAQDIRPWRFKR